MGHCGGLCVQLSTNVINHCLGQTYLMLCCSSPAGQNFSIFVKKINCHVIHARACLKWLTVCGSVC